MEVQIKISLTRRECGRVFLLCGGVCPGSNGFISCRRRFSLRQNFLRHIEKKWVMNDHALKQISAVYVIVAYSHFNKLSDIVYVGSTTNLFLRYKSHKIPKKVQDSGNMNILYFIPMAKGFYDHELKLIRKLKPSFNRNYRNG